MPRVLVGELGARLGATVAVAGWVHRVRSLGKIAFVLLRDRSGIAQLVFSGAVDLTVETVISAQGSVEANDRAPGGFEVHVVAHQVLARADPDLPISINQHTDRLNLEAILDHRMLSLRIPKVLEVFRVQATVVEAFASHMREEGFTEIKTAKLIGSGTEGGTGLFSVRYFDRDVFLAQSPQLYKQAMVAAGLERVFEVGHAYRAEKHDTPRHLNEYVSLDVEMAFIESEHDLMDLEQRILKTIFQTVDERHAPEFEARGVSVPTAKEVDAMPRLVHDDALRIASERVGKRFYEITPEAERELCVWALTTHGVEACFVHGDPRSKRPFYTHPAPDGKTMSFDLIFRGVEITTGGRRIEQHDALAANVDEFGLSRESLADYLQIFRFGCPPHGGFAIGLERLTQRLLGLENIRQASLFPRDRKRARP